MATYLIFLLGGCFLLAVAEAESHHPQDFLKSIAGKQDEGKEIVQHFCANCHAQRPLIPLGAPEINQKIDWEPRLMLGAQSILKHTAEGFNAMPARGGCFECSDKQLIKAIVAMLPEELKKSFFSALKDHKKNK
jgi:cytochrome c5